LRALIAPQAVFQDLTSIAIDSDSRFFFQGHAVFAGSCKCTVRGKVLGLELEQATFTHGLIVVLQIKDGKVVSQRDHADHDSFTAELKTLAEGDGGR